MRHPAIKFRRKVYVANPRHQDALDAAFKGMSRHQIGRIYDRVAAGKEEIVFGFANMDGTDFVEADLQAGRKAMYGFETAYGEG